MTPEISHPNCKELTLSDKRRHSLDIDDNDTSIPYCYYYSEKDVREAIKKLKKKLDLVPTDYLLISLRMERWINEVFGTKLTEDLE